MKLPSIFFVLFALACTACTPTGKRAAEPARESPTAPNAGDWNYPAIAWSNAESSLERMKTQGRPGMVMIMAEWCSRCKELQSVFKDPEIMAMSKNFELILLDQDAAPSFAARWSEDGNYVPRTYFLRPDGSVDQRLQGPSPEYRYYFPAGLRDILLTTMKKAADNKG